MPYGPVRDGHRAHAVGPGAGDVQRGVADHRVCGARVGLALAGPAPGDRRQLGAVLGVGAEGALAAREVVAEAGAVSLSRAIGSKLPVTARAARPRARPAAPAARACPARRGRRCRAGARRGRGTRPRRKSSAALVDPRGAEARLQEHLARDLQVGLARRLATRNELGSSMPKTSCSAALKASLVRLRGLEEQRAVDVEEQSSDARRSALERGARPEPLGERGDEPRRVRTSSSCDELDRRVHVAQRDRRPARWARRPATEWMASASVPVRAAADVDRERDVLGLGGLVQQLEDLRVQRRAAHDHRARAESGACPAP